MSGKCSRGAHHAPKNVAQRVGKSLSATGSMGDAMALPVRCHMWIWARSGEGEGWRSPTNRGGRKLAPLDPRGRCRDHQILLAGAVTGEGEPISVRFRRKVHRTRSTVRETVQAVVCVRLQLPAGCYRRVERVEWGCGARRALWLRHRCCSRLASVDPQPDTPFRDLKL